MPIPPIPPDVAAAASAKAGREVAKGSTRLGVRTTRGVARSGIRLILHTIARILWRIMRFIALWVLVPFIMFTLLKLGVDAANTKLWPSSDLLTTIRLRIDSQWWNIAHLLSSLIPEWFTWNI